jgi:multidrug resistance efflux pump
MKVRFSSTKERSPDQENGLRVLYGTSKRAAYKLRWYLIVALVSSPLLYLAGRVLINELRPEMPAQLSMPILELRASVGGTVAELPVKVGEQVKAGQLLIQLDNPEWRLRLQQLQPGNLRRDDQLGSSAEAIATNTINLQDQMVKLYKGLQREGGLSSAELLKSEVDLNAQKLALVELERRLRQDDFPYKGEPIQNLRDQRERDWISGRLKLLNLRALTAGRIAEVLVNPGENVGSGTLLMRIEEDVEPLVWVYLQPKQAREARAGQPLEVEMPDGSWVAAKVIEQADLARRLPPGLGGTAGGNNLALQVPVRFVEPLPTIWRVDQLPLRVRFPLRWPQFGVRRD